PRDPANIMGPVVSKVQRDRVMGFVRRALADGAQLVAGGSDVAGKGFFVEPTVIADVDPLSESAQEEIFGSVLVVQTHEGDDDAVRLANLSVYGLGGAVWSGSVEHGV